MDSSADATFVTDASIASSPDAGMANVVDASLETTPGSLIRIGSTDVDHNVFVVDTNGATWIDLSSGVPRRRCPFPKDSSVHGVSGNGHVAISSGEKNELAIMELEKSCDRKPTGIYATLGGTGLSGRLKSNAFSDDGSRLALVSEDASDTAKIYALPSAKLLADCSTHAVGGGPDADLAISGDARGLIWQHDREGTWVENLNACSEQRTAVVAESASYDALISPHRRFLVECPYVDFASTVHRGFFVRSIGSSGLGARFDATAFADDDYGFCEDHLSAFSPDDTRIAFEDGARVRIFSLTKRKEEMQIGESTVRSAMSQPSVWTGPLRALAFAAKGDAILIADDRHIVVVDLRAYQAYLKSSMTKYEDEKALLDRATMTIAIGD